MNGLRQTVRIIVVSRQAPTLLLKSSTGEGFATDIVHEFNIAYGEMIQVGVDSKVEEKVTREAYRYFDGLGGFK